MLKHQYIQHSFLFKLVHNHLYNKYLYFIKNDYEILKIIKDQNP